MKKRLLGPRASAENIQDFYLILLAFNPCFIPAPPLRFQRRAYAGNNGAVYKAFKARRAVCRIRKEIVDMCGINAKYECPLASVICQGGKIHETR
jgi:hypothetical protein